LVDKYLSFLPDIIVLAGTAESITKVMVPLEAQWPKNDSDMDLTPRPYYVLIDSNRVTELTAAATNNVHDLARRVRGTGLNPGPAGSASAETYELFRQDYMVRYNGASAEISGLGPAHDAAYAIGLALAATHTEPVSGASVAAGLRKLAGGATKLNATGTNVLPAFQKLAAGQKITLTGTFGALDWDANGAVVGGTLEMWCIGGTAAKPAYASSGLLFDIKDQTLSGSYVPCTP